jgi:hypothetical protein
MEKSKLPLQICDDFVLIFIILMLLMADNINEFPFVKIENDENSPLTNRFDLNEISGHFLR